MEDLEFSLEIQKLIIDESYWSGYAWMNNATANEIVLDKFEKKIKKHPILWKLFFKIH